jgi:hypothetical protein
VSILPLFDDAFPVRCTGAGKEKKVVIVGGIALFVACLFLVYVLVQFHIEATRPRRQSPRSSGRVIVLRRKIVKEPLPFVVSRPKDDAQPQQAKSEAPTGGNANSIPVVPIGVRRLAVKRAGRN